MGYSVTRKSNKYFRACSHKTCGDKASVIWWISSRHLDCLEFWTREAVKCERWSGGKKPETANSFKKIREEIFDYQIAITAELSQGAWIIRLTGILKTKMIPQDGNFVQKYKGGTTRIDSHSSQFLNQC